MFRNRFMLYRHRHLMFIDSGEQSGGSGEPSAEPEKPTGETDGEDRSKDFSRALAKRVAEIEAKYSDYEELKAKAAKYDERESESKSDMDKLNERLAAIEKERDELKASEEHPGGQGRQGDRSAGRSGGNALRRRRIRVEGACRQARRAHVLQAAEAASRQPTYRPGGRQARR